VNVYHYSFLDVTNRSMSVSVECFRLFLTFLRPEKLRNIENWTVRDVHVLKTKESVYKFVAS